MSRQKFLAIQGPPFSPSLHRDVKLDVTPEIEVFHMLFERCYSQNGKDLFDNTQNTSTESRSHWRAKFREFHMAGHMSYTQTFGMS